MKQEYIIKKNIFGGFRRTDVINCFATLTENSDTYTHDEIDNAHKKIEKLNLEIEKRNIVINKHLTENNINTHKSENTTAVQTANEVLDEAKKEVAQIETDIRKYVNSKQSNTDQIIAKTSDITKMLDQLHINMCDLSEKLNSFDFEKTTQSKSIKIELPKTKENTDKTFKDKTNKNSEKSLNPILKTTQKETIESNKAEEDLQKDLQIANEIIDNEPVPVFNSIDNFFAEMDKLIAVKKNPEPYLSVINENPIEHLE